MSDMGTEESAHVRTAWVVPVWAVGVPAVLLIGFLALLGRAGVGIQILGLPLGAYLTPLPSVLIVGLIASTRGRMLLRSFDRSQRRVAIAVALALAAGLLRAAAQGMPTLLRFQDMAYLLHLPWIVVGMAAMRALPSDEERSRVLRWLAWTLAVVLTLHWARGPIPVVGSTFDALITALEGASDKPDLVLKAGDRTMFGFALGALALTWRGEASRARLIQVLLAGAIIASDVGSSLLGGSRGALLGGAIGSILLLGSRGLSRGSRSLLSAGFAVGLVVGLSPLVAALDVGNGTDTRPDTRLAQPPDVEPSTERSRPAIVERYEELAGQKSLSETLTQFEESTANVGWRLAIWQDVVEEWNDSWSNRVVGIGFGNDIEAMTVPGRQGFDGLNRGVHSIAFTITARQGLVGLAAAAWVLFSLLSASSAGRFAPLVASGLVIALFDVFLEGVQAPVLLWSIVGMLLVTPVEESEVPIQNR